jgi:hypothetical protein
MSTDISVDEAKDLICQLCRNFYQQGWVSGTGGGISMKAGDKIVMAPSGVQKERMEPDDMFVLDAQGNVLHTPVTRPPPYKAPKLSECAPLFTAVSDSGWWGSSHMPEQSQLLYSSLYNQLFQYGCSHTPSSDSLSHCSLQHPPSLQQLQHTAHEAPQAPFRT